MAFVWIKLSDINQYVETSDPSGSTRKYVDDAEHWLNSGQVQNVSIDVVTGVIKGDVYPSMKSDMYHAEATWNKATETVTSATCSCLKSWVSATTR